MFSALLRAVCVDVDLAPRARWRGTETPFPASDEDLAHFKSTKLNLNLKQADKGCGKSSHALYLCRRELKLRMSPHPNSNCHIRVYIIIIMIYVLFVRVANSASR